jgi:hypothetical protein
MESPPLYIIDDISSMGLIPDREGDKMTEKEQRTGDALQRFWTAYDRQNWDPDSTWTAGMRPVSVVSGFKIKSNLDKIRRESDVSVHETDEVLTMLEILKEPNKADKMQNVRRIQCRMSFEMKDLLTGQVMETWVGEGVGEGTDFHTSGSACGIAYRNGMIHHFNIVENSDEPDEESSQIPEVKIAENENVKKMLEGNKIPPAVHKEPLLDKVKQTVQVKQVKTEVQPLTDATKTEAREMMVEILRSGLSAEVLRECATEFNGASLRASEADMQTWMNKYSKYRPKKV